jgi:hypothetical protein
VPYEITFVRRVLIAGPEQYINDCCVGGDLVVSQLLPSVRERYTDVRSDQEDWGWFIWFRQGGVRLAIDVFTMDAERGMFTAHLTSRTKRLLVLDTVVDTPELEELRALVTSQLSAWGARDIRVLPLDRNDI